MAGQSRGVYCALCGLPFDGSNIEISDPLPEPLPDDFMEEFYEPHYDASLLDSEQLEWLNSYRVITFADDEIPTDPDVAYDDTVQISTKASWDEEFPRQFSFRGSKPRATQNSWDIAANFGLSQIYNGRNYGQNLENTGNYRVPLHDACLEIAYRVVSWRAENATTERQSSRPTKLSEIRHGVWQYREGGICAGPRPESLSQFYGADQFQRDGWDSVPGYEWMVASPIENCDMTQIISQRLGKAKPIEESAFGSRQLPDTSVSCLETLPAPAIDKLLDNLDIESILKLRRCSSGMYAALVLTNKFWKDRFLAGEAVPWLWDLDIANLASIDVERDWRDLAKQLVEIDLEADKDLPIGIRNRIRIWRIISDIRLASC